MLSIERNRVFREFPRKHPLPNLGIRRKPFPIEFLTETNDSSIVLVKEKLDS